MKSSFIVIYTGLLLISAWMLWHQHQLQEVILPQRTPTTYDIVLECQKLSAQAIDKFRIEKRDDKDVRVVFGYEDCKKELINAVKSGAKILTL